jgi:hypothetical protein
MVEPEPKPEPKPKPKVKPTTSPDRDGMRIRYGRDLVALGLVIVFATFVIAILFYGSAQDVIAVVAPVTTLVGTLVGTIFGVQSATQATAEQQKTAVASARLAADAAVLVDPDKAEQLYEQWNSTTNGNPGEGDFS